MPRTAIGPMFTRRKTVTMIIGEPCTGKSTLVRALVNGWDFYDVKWTPHYVSPDGSQCVIGKGYEDPSQQFPGTDRLSQAVAPHAVAFIANTKFRHYIVEGTRLGNGKFLDTMVAANYRVQVFKTGVPRDVLEARRAAERVQSERFLKSARTQVSNLSKHAREVLGSITIVPTLKPSQTALAVKMLTDPFKPVKIVGS